MAAIPGNISYRILCSLVAVLPDLKQTEKVCKDLIGPVFASNNPFSVVGHFLRHVRAGAEVLARMRDRGEPSEGHNLDDRGLVAQELRRLRALGWQGAAPDIKWPPITDGYINRYHPSATTPASGTAPGASSGAASSAAGAAPAPRKRKRTPRAPAEDDDDIDDYDEDDETYRGPKRRRPTNYQHTATRPRNEKGPNYDVGMGDEEFEEMLRGEEGVEKDEEKDEEREEEEREQEEDEDEKGEGEEAEEEEEEEEKGEKEAGEEKEDGWEGFDD
ncbi:hypothetical protein GE09DRAFT_1275398 [Coniochaeta sp. 2T2.1]|nr:hypothetical protein GE09DRAFT_1275398 [Coniochaeta sp. 2T2.1]